ncbi:MAG: hypothetical protein PHO32_07020 [Candidatus Cloacimonetes bacterium]|nr:hypothetical protein [Candidatus Cloacimonadota bacterium]
MRIDVSESAKQHLQKRLEFYQYKNRKPRIVLVAQTCHGAEFRVVFEVLDTVDVEVSVDGFSLYVPTELMEEYGGFSLDMEIFFFAPRLVVKPLMQSFKCDCKTKCNNAKSGV